MKPTKLKSIKTVVDDDPILDVDEMLTKTKKEFDQTKFSINPCENNDAKYRNWLLGIANQNSLPFYSIIDMSFSLSDYKYFLHNHSLLSKPPFQVLDKPKQKEPCYSSAKFSNCWNTQCKLKDQLESFHEESMLICSMCNSRFHFQCLGLSAEAFQEIGGAEWNCSLCEEIKNLEKVDLSKVLGKRKYGEIYQCKTKCKTGKTCNKYFVSRRTWQRHYIQIHNKKVENMVIFPQNLLQKLDG
jgi:hypothetical protein